MRIRSTFYISVLFMAILIFSMPVVTHAQLFDGELEGLLIGGGLGYAAAIATGADSSGESFSVSGFTATGFTATGRIGYGLSDQLAIYFSSPVLNLVPSLGVMYFPERGSDYYLQGSIGYKSANLYSLLAIEGGIGYELRDQVTLEGMLGYNRFSYTYATYGGSLFYGGFTTGATPTINIITVAVTFNVYFY